MNEGKISLMFEVSVVLGSQHGTVRTMRVTLTEVPPASRLIIWPGLTITTDEEAGEAGGGGGGGEVSWSWSCPVLCPD